MILTCWSLFTPINWNALYPPFSRDSEQVNWWCERGGDQNQTSVHSGATLHQNWWQDFQNDNVTRTVLGTMMFRWTIKFCSPPPQGWILPIETKCLMYVNASDLWSLQISLLICNDHRSSIDIHKTFGFNRPGQCPLKHRFLMQPSPSRIDS